MDWMVSTQLYIYTAVTSTDKSANTIAASSCVSLHVDANPRLLVYEQITDRTNKHIN